MAGQTANRAVLAGVLDVLNVSAFTDLSGGVVTTGIPPGTSFPYTWVTARERRFDTFGTNGKEVDVRVHVYSDHVGDDEAIRIIDKAAELLDDERGQAVKIAASGYDVLQMLYEGDLTLPDELIGAVQVRHRVGIFTATVLEA